MGGEDEYNGPLDRDDESGPPPAPVDADDDDYWDTFDEGFAVVLEDGGSELDLWTARMFAAQSMGVPELADQIAEIRNQIAVGDDTGITLQHMKDELAGGDFGQFLTSAWGHKFDQNMQIAFGYLIDHPDMAEQAQNATSEQTRVDILLKAYEYGVATNTKPQMIDSVPELGSESPTDRMMAQQELNQVLEQFPVGSAGYAMPSVQQRVEYLNRIIVGDLPLVGARGRSI